MINDNLERCIRLILNSNSQQQPQNERIKPSSSQQPLVLVAVSNKQLNNQQKTPNKPSAPLITIPVTVLTQKTIQPLKVVGGSEKNSVPQSLPVFAISSSKPSNTFTLNELNSNALQIVSIPQSVIRQLQTNAQPTTSTTVTNKPKPKTKPRSTSQRLTTARVLYQQSCNAAAAADKEDSPTIASTLAYHPLTDANPIGVTTVDGINLQEIKEFAKLFKMRRLALGLTQTQVGQALSAAKGPAYSQSAICRFEKLDITPKSAAKIKPVLEKWMQEAEKKYADRLKQGSQQHFADLIGDMNSKKRKRRTSFTPKALDRLNKAFETNTHPSGSEMTSLASELDYDRERMRPQTSDPPVFSEPNSFLGQTEQSDDYSQMIDRIANDHQQQILDDMFSAANDEVLPKQYPNHYSHQSSSIGSEQLAFTPPCCNYINPIDSNLNMFNEEPADGMDFFESLLRTSREDDFHFIDSLLNSCEEGGGRRRPQ